MAVRLHDRALPHGLFGQLGDQSFTAYYRTFIDSPFATALGAETDTGNVGMLIGSLDTRRHYDWVLRRRGLPLLLRGAFGLLMNPRQLIRFLRTRTACYARALWRRVRSMPNPQVRTPTAPTAVLTHMAVAQHHRHHGAGAALVEAFVEHARQHGASAAHLVTLGTDNRAGTFYERLGWRLEHTRHDWDGRPLRAYRYDL